MAANEQGFAMPLNLKYKCSKFIQMKNRITKVQPSSVSKGIAKLLVIGSMVDSKALVLENGFIIDIPKELINYLNSENIEWDWYDTRYSFWKENREATMKFFSELPIGKSIYCHTCFDGFQQLELFIQLLYKFKEKQFTFKIMHGCLAEDLLKFFDETESSITPDEIEKELDDAETNDEFIAANKKVKEFKKQMNEMFLEVLSCHNIYWINWHDEYLFKTLEDVKKANEF